MRLVEPIVVLVKVEGIVDCGGCELDVHHFSQFVEFFDVRRIRILHGQSESNVLDSHPVESCENSEGVVEAVGHASDLIVGTCQAFNTDPNADAIPVLFEQFDCSIDKPAVAADDDPVGF
jgi:hypothetical protein